MGDGREITEETTINENYLQYLKQRTIIVWVLMNSNKTIMNSDMSRKKILTNMFTALNLSKNRSHNRIEHSLSD